MTRLIFPLVRRCIGFQSLRCITVPLAPHPLKPLGRSNYHTISHQHSIPSQESSQKCSQSSQEEEPKPAAIDDAFVAATDTQVARLEEVFLKHKSPFVTSGTVSLQSNRFGLYYSAEGGDKGANFTTLPLTDAAAKAVFDAGKPSLFGRGKSNVLDETYRLAHELLPPDFALSVDIVSEYSILRSIQHYLAIEAPLRAEMSKLNAYPTGGFFKPHRDTPCGEDHIGTLTLCLPSSFKGGELVVRHRDGTATFDWAKEVQGVQSADGQSDTVVAWTFLYSDCEHEVLPVTEGTRITLAYDVFAEHEELEAEAIADPPVDELAASLKAACTDPLFLPAGGSLAFGLQYSYPIKTFTDNWDDNFMASHLKSGDQTWLAAIKAANLEWSTCAVYNYDINDRIYANYTFEDDPEQPPLTERYLYKERDLAAAKTFWLMEGEHLGEDDNTVDMMEQNLLGKQHVAWVTQPGEWSGSNNYTTYGNNFNTAYEYVTVALVAKIPPAAERSME